MSNIQKIMEAYKSMKVSEKTISEDHFDVGDKVKCTKTGKVGKVVKTDAEQKGEYYSVEIDGKVSKFAPDCLVKESLEEARGGNAKTFKTLEDWLMAVLSIKGATVSKMGDTLRASGLGRAQSATFELKKGRGSLLEEVELGEGSCKSKKEELDAVNDKENDKKFKDRKDKDIDNDGDVDSSDEYLHKKRAATDDAIDSKEDEEKKDIKKNPKTKDGKAEISKIESVDTREAFIAMWSDLEEAKDPKKGATAPEKHDSTASPKTKEVIAKHSKSDDELEDEEEESREITFKAGGKSMKKAGPRNSADKLGKS